MRGITTKFFALGICLLVVCSCYNSFNSEGELIEYEASSALTISELHAMYDQMYVRTFNEDFSVSGVVSATDREGNFYKSFVMQSDGFAIEILEGLYDSFIRHPEGYEVTIELNGVAMSRSYGVLQIGLPSTNSYYALDYLTIEPTIDEHIKRGGYVEEVEPLKTTLADLNTSLCGRLVEIENLTLSYSENSIDQIAQWGGYHLFTDEDDNKIYLYVSTYSNWAYQPINAKDFTLRGILQYGSVNNVNRYIIKPRCFDDLMTYSL